MDRFSLIASFVAVCLTSIVLKRDQKGVQLESAPPCRFTSIKGNHEGFTLVELLIVVAVILIATAMTFPALSTAVEQYRLRTAAGNLATFLQTARMQAVKNDRLRSVQIATVTNGGSAVTQFFVDVNGDGVADSGEPVIQLSSDVTLVSSPSGITPLDSVTLGFQPQASTVLVSFNGRGTPCVLNASNICASWAGTGAAAPAVGFLYYLNLRSNTADWAAVSVSPSGRLRVWNYANGRWQ